jgi:hypothetical protein
VRATPSISRHGSLNASRDTGHEVSERGPTWTEAVAAPGSPRPRCFPRGWSASRYGASRYLMMMPAVGFEPTTFGLKVSYLQARCRKHAQLRAPISRWRRSESPTEQKPRPRAAESAFDPIVSQQACS